MAASLTVWLLIGLAFVLANLPFVTESLFGVFRLERRKSLWVRFLELMLLYSAAGLVGWLMERQLGQVAAQKWEFFAITLALFATFSFPGFVYCCLWRHKP